jgi:hypothetical protein
MVHKICEKKNGVKNATKFIHILKYFMLFSIIILLDVDPWNEVSIKLLST